MKHAFLFSWLLVSALSTTNVFCQKTRDVEPGENLREKASRLAMTMLIIDGHVDVPYRFQGKVEDISVRTPTGDFDYPRARSGGLDAPFMSIFVPSSYEQKGGGRAFADRLIDMVEGFQKQWPDKFALAFSPAEIRKHFEKGIISLPMGMENGTPIEGRLSNIGHFHRRGIRYMTLTHSKDNHICDSSYDTTRTWKGLSPFGRGVIAEMNRIGMIVDVSHISDSTFYQVMRLTRAPVIASHSSCRHFTPEWERNMSDAMIKTLAANGGVIHINFGSSFIRDDFRKKRGDGLKIVRQYLAANSLSEHTVDIMGLRQMFRDSLSTVYVDVLDVVDHIDHVVRIAGVDHVGFGSDFDGVGDSLPIGLKDVSYYPTLIYHLLQRGYSEEDIRKMCSDNTLRVWSAVEDIARNYSRE